MTLRIELSENATLEEREAILTPLRAYNASKAGPTVSTTRFSAGFMAECFTGGFSLNCCRCRTRPGDKG